MAAIANERFMRFENSFRILCGFSVRRSKDRSTSRFSSGISAPDGAGAGKKRELQTQAGTKGIIGVQKSSVKHRLSVLSDQFTVRSPNHDAAATTVNCCSLLPIPCTLFQCAGAAWGCGASTPGAPAPCATGAGIPDFTLYASIIVFVMSVEGTAYSTVAFCWSLASSTSV